MNRTDVIQHFIDRIGAKTYLEIGVAKGNNFSKIRVDKKIAVDPRFGLPPGYSKKPNESYHEITSDRFFKEYDSLIGDIELDVVFVDGLHTYEQSLKDINNSLDHLNKNGFVVVHDCNPKSEAAAQKTQSDARKLRQRDGDKSTAWNGDVYKTLIYLRSSRKDLNIFTLDCDQGLGIITKGKPEDVLNEDLNNIKDIIYVDFAKKREYYLNLKGSNFLIKNVRHENPKIKATIKETGTRKIKDSVQAIICGHEHSGTTMLMDILSNHPSINSGFEIGFLLVDKPRDFIGFDPFYKNMLDGWKIKKGDLDKICDTDDFAEAYSRLREISPLVINNNKIIDKTPRYMQRLEEVLEKAPGVPCVAIIRDPRSLVWSSCKHDIGLRNIDRNEMIDEWFKEKYPASFNHLLSYYIALKYALLGQNKDRIMVVSYEELCRYPKKILPKIFKHCGLEYNDKYMDISSTKFKENIYGSHVDTDFISEYKSRMSKEKCEEIIENTLEYIKSIKNTGNILSTFWRFRIRTAFIKRALKNNLLGKYFKDILKERSRPDFLCIGMQKAGTTWLYENIKRHPNFWALPIKEVHYFDEIHAGPMIAERRLLSAARNMKRLLEKIPRALNQKLGGIGPILSDLKFFNKFGFTKNLDDRYYESLWESAPASMLTGDFTPDYSILSINEIRHCRKVNPKMKIILLLRNPIDRAWSASRMWADTKGIDPTLCYNKPFIINRSKIKEIVENWENVFPKENIFYGFYDDIVNDPLKLLRQICDFLNVRYKDKYFPRSKEKIFVGKPSDMPENIRDFYANTFKEDFDFAEKRFGGYATLWREKYTKSLKTQEEQKSNNTNSSRSNHELLVETIEQAILAPCLTDMRGKAILGVVDSEGKLRLKEMPKRIEDGQFTFSRNTIKPTGILKGTYIFAGHLQSHFGHFILEGLSRIWYIKKHPEIPIIWIPMYNSAEPNHWQKEILSLLNIKNEQIIIQKPTIVERLIIPTPGLLLREFFDVEHAKSLAIFDTKESEDKKLWLSRSMIQPRNSKSIITNEDELEKILATKGWMIFHPEKHAIKEQIMTLASAKHIAGFNGSAFHTLIFLNEVRAKITVLERRANPMILRNMKIIADTKKLNQSIHKISLTKAESKDGWKESYKISSYDEVVKILEENSIT
ncbi:MAG: sulfotransferase [Candidatus Paceibacterota bacterium]|jgi:hypothetical protein